MRARQQSFLRSLKVNTRLDHGGDISRGKRKTARPFDPKRPLHLVLRSTQAKGVQSMLHPRNEGRITAAIDQVSRKYRVRIYRRANVGNHLHLLIQARSRADFQRFLRELAGVIAVLMTGAIKGAPKKFWDKLAYSRVVSWGREFETVMDYVLKNLFEAAGLWNRKRDPHARVIRISLENAGLGPPG